jgi:hypothetical protein
LESLTSLPPDAEFRNGAGVNLSALTSLPPGVEFRNGRDINLGSLSSIPPGVEFKNGSNVFLKQIGYFYDWKGNIEGIDPKRLLNMMIKQGVFER